MSLTILQVAYPFSTVGLDAVGGAEQILATLDRALIEAGHRSLVIAAPGSRTAGRLLPCGSGPRRILPQDQSRTHLRFKALIEYVLHTEHVDLVHFHGLDFAEYLPRTKQPLLATLHLPPRLYPPHIFSDVSFPVSLNCVSESQHRSCPACPQLCSPIPNGVDLSAFEPRYAKEDYVVALGRICPEKGYHLAIEAARRACLPLLIAGRVFPYPAHVRYFEEQLSPLLGEDCRFVGPVGPSQRAGLLSGAKALLVPSSIEETSSLVAMEAFASGTPVIAFRRGALSEVVEDGQTGFLVDDVSQMADAIRRIGEIDGHLCRRAAEARFSAARMSERYFTLYRNLAGSLADVG